MSTRDAAYALIEQALNAYVRLDEEALRRLRPLHGRVILLRIEGAGLEFYLVPGADGIQVYPDYESEPDCTLSGTPLGFARMSDRSRSADTLFEGEVEIRGNTEIGHRFGDVLGGLDIDWEEQLSRVTGDVLAHRVGSTVRSTGRWARETGEILPQDLKEYLQEELRLLPVRFETDEFAAAVDTLRDDVERLEARIERLRRRAEDPAP